MSQKSKKQKSVLLYIVILILSLALIAVCILGFISMMSLKDLKTQLTNVKATVQQLSDDVDSLRSQADQLAQLQEETSQLEEEQQQLTSEPPSDSSVSSEETEADSREEEDFLAEEPPAETQTDEELSALMEQINLSLPTDNGSWSVYVSNLSAGSSQALNSHPMQAASLIKLYIMAAVYDQYDSLSAVYGSGTLNNLLYPMITVSDNDAANTLTSYLGNGDSAAGMAAVNSFCQSHGFSDSHMGRLLLHSNEYDDNYTSVNDCGRLLKEIYESVRYGSTTSLSHTEDMYNLLKQQTRQHKIPANLPEGVHAANKTGELSDVENDAAIIYDTAKDTDLVICFMSENLYAPGNAQASIASLSRSIYDYYNQ